MTTEQFASAQNPEITTAIERPVTDFKSASLHENPLLYPGERPEGSYVTDGAMVSNLRVGKNEQGNLDISVATADGEVSLNEYLAAHGAAPVEERIPVLSYGANVCPASLLAKYTKVERPDALVVPTLYATLPGHDVVWSAGPGMNGNFIASLYSGPETTDTAVQVGVSLLTREQILVLHTTELAYDLHKVNVDIEGVSLPVYYYAGKDEVFVDNKKPVAVEGIPAKNRTINEANTTDMLEMLLHKPDVMDQLRQLQADFPEWSPTAESYVAYVKTLRKTADNPSPRLDLKRRLHACIAASGLSRVSTSADAESMSWANPSTLQTFSESQRGQTADEPVYVLPTSELSAAEWPNPDARSKVLHAINEHFHRHFPQDK